VSKSKPYIPAEFPPKDLILEPFIKKIVEANRGVALFDGVLRALPNPDILLAPLTTNEAVLSSRIEGTPKRTGISILNKLLDSNLISLRSPSRGSVPAIYELENICNIIGS